MAGNTETNASPGFWRRNRGFFFGLGVGVVAILLLQLLVFASGALNMTATREPGLLDSMGEMAYESSLRWRAPDTRIPAEVREAELDAPLRHYGRMCLQCHGAPGVERDVWADNMLPEPPHLAEEAEEYADGELYYILQHGIRMTGMPAFGPDHSDRELWGLVHVTRQLGALSQEQKQTLQQTAGQQGHAHGGQADHHGDDATRGEADHHEGDADDHHETQPSDAGGHGAANGSLDVPDNAPAQPHESHDH
jgi:mono/diheme cytochrome c family protein